MTQQQEGDTSPLPQEHPGIWVIDCLGPCTCTPAALGAASSFSSTNTPVGVRLATLQHHPCSASTRRREHWCEEMETWVSITLGKRSVSSGGW